MSHGASCGSPSGRPGTLTSASGTPPPTPAAMSTSAPAGSPATGSATGTGSWPGWRLRANPGRSASPAVRVPAPRSTAGRTARRTESARRPFLASRSAARRAASSTGSARLPGSASRQTASRAMTSRNKESSRAMSSWVTESWPPPGGSANPWAQPSTGEASGLRARPFSFAVQPPYGSASTRVPPLAGTVIALPFGALDDSAVTVPSGATARTRATGPVTCQRS